MLTASHWGLFYAKTKDGRLVAVRPFEGDRAPSPNLSSLVEHPYSSARIQTPMVRRSYLEKGSASRAGRGADEYVPVSWDKALDLAAGELRRIYETYGPSAVWGRSYGWKSTGSVNNAIALMQRLLSLLGGWVETGNSYSTAAISTILPYAVGGKLFKPTVWPVIKEKTHLPIIVDPSHATGDYKYIESMALAAVAAGADGLEIEVHDNPQCAWSDGAQCLKPEKFAETIANCRKVAAAIGREM